MIQLNKDLFRMDFEKVHIEELYNSCSTDLERDIVLIIQECQMQLREKQKRIDKALNFINDEFCEEGGRSLILCDDEVVKLKHILKGEENEYE